MGGYKGCTVPLALLRSGASAQQEAGLRCLCPDPGPTRVWSCPGFPAGLPGGLPAPPSGHSGLAHPSCCTGLPVGSWDPSLLWQEIPGCREMRPPPSDWLFGPEHPSIGVAKAFLGVEERKLGGLCMEWGRALLPSAALTWPVTSTRRARGLLRLPRRTTRGWAGEGGIPFLFA